MTFEARHISVPIDRPADVVYAFASDPEHLPLWAAGLGAAIRRVGDDWIVETPEGAATVKFAEPNAYGILDHVVTLPSGVTVSNPMRIIPNGDGSECVFTLLRRPGMPAEEFLRDAALVERDLLTLKALLERSG